MKNMSYDQYTNMKHPNREPLIRNTSLQAITIPQHHQVVPSDSTISSVEWKDDVDEFEAPCPYIARYCISTISSVECVIDHVSLILQLTMSRNCPYPCCCCCTLSRSHRQQCALSCLYNACYVVVYLLV